ncbi:MAG: HD-GYP domain-containing protein [Coriobacteriia bacterium]|nr:HD-GYP domain-containing protein [Coriobacteriia bacterium]
MEQARRFFVQHFEIFVVITLVVATTLTLFVVVDKLAFLNFFYIPVLAASYYLGRTRGLLTGIVAVLLIALFAFLNPDFLGDFMRGSPVTSVILWGAFLIVTAWIVGGLYEAKTRTLSQLQQAYDGIVELLAKFIDVVDGCTKEHSVRVAELAVSIANTMSLSERECEHIRVAGLLHDIGKIEVSMDVLTKASMLTEEEWDEMRTHTTKAAELLGPVGDVLRDVIPIVVNHHEYFDGGGYQGVRGREIPIGARVLAVADAYDSIITDRPYRAGKPSWEAVAEIERRSGSQFDPDVVQAFMSVHRALMQYV